MEAVEVSNYVLKVTDMVLRDNPRFTGKIEIEINCNAGGIGSVTAQEKRKIDVKK